jgi:hypothetical protein
MAITESYTGSAVIGSTEFSLPNSSTTLTPISTIGVYQIFIDTSAMSFGDQYEITVYEKITASTNQRTIFNAVLTGIMADCWVSPSLILLHGWDVTIQKLAGTDRTMYWSIRRVL